MVFGPDQPFAPSVGSFQVPVVAPDRDPDEGDQVTVCFSAAWLPLVIGALQQLTLQATWQGDTETIQAAQDRAQLLIAMFGGDDGGCLDTVCIKGLIYDSDCDCIKQTFDGGETYVENPGADPRHNAAYLFPPVDAMDPRCQAAANMSRYYSDLIDQVVLVVDEAGTAEGLLAIILPFIVELGPFAILIEVVLGVAFTLFSAGAIAITAAFTSEVFDQLTCIFYCHLASDGSCSASQLESIKTQIDADIGGLAALVLQGMLLVQGEVGLSNAGTIGAAPADCSDCACGWCSILDAMNQLGDWEPLGWVSQQVTLPSWDGTQWNNGEVHNGVNGAGHNVTYIHLRWTFDDPVDITFTSTLEPERFDLGIGWGMYANGDGTIFSGTKIFGAGGGVNLPITATSLEVLIFIVDSLAALTFDSTELQGIADVNPFGESNC